jgi:Rap1a immunity proteins
MMIKLLFLAMIAPMCIGSNQALSQVKSHSGSALFDACRSIGTAKITTDTLMRQAGLCEGAINAAAILLKGVTYCPPTEVNFEQTLRIVVAYMEDHPSELNEELVLLATRALTNTWPCKR